MKRRYNSNLTILYVFLGITLGAFTLSALQVPLPELALPLLASASVIAFAILAFRKPDWAIYIATIELVLGGASGKWLELPQGISLRIGMFFILLLVLLVLFLRKKITLKTFTKSKFFYPIIILAIGFPLFFGLVIGMINGNSLSFIFSDANGHFFYLFFLILFGILTTHKKLWQFFLVYFFAIVASALLIDILYSLSISHVIDILQVKYFFRQYTFGGNAVGIMPSGAYRIYLGSGIFYQIGLAIALSMAALTKNKQLRWFSVFSVPILIFAVSATYTRGFWVGAIISMLLIIILIRKSLRKKMVVALIFFFIAAFMGSWYIFQYSLFHFYSERLISSIPYVERINDIPIFKNLDSETKKKVINIDQVRLADPWSSDYKLIQSQTLWSEIKQKPILGHGFGAVIKEYGDGFSFELTYLDMLFKFGFLGMAIWGLIIFMILKKGFQKIRAQIDPDKKALLLGAVTGLAGLLFTASTNPYIMASFGIAHIVITLFIIERISANDKVKTKK